MREDRLVTTPLSLSTNRGDDGTLVLSAAGELDLSNVDTFARALNLAISEAIDEAVNPAGGTEGTVTLDFSGIEYLDSSAINVLFTNAGRIRGLVINPLLSSVVTVSGLNEILTVEPPPGDKPRSVN
jgi:anti-anti-sigma factor